MRLEVINGKGAQIKTSAHAQRDIILPYWNITDDTVEEVAFGETQRVCRF